MQMTPLLQYFDSLNKILDAKERRKLERDYKRWLKDKFEWFEFQHHILTANNHGMGMKPNDLWLIPARDQNNHDAYHGRLNEKENISLDKQLEWLEVLHEQFMSDKGM